MNKRYKILGISTIKEKLERQQEEFDQMEKEVITIAALAFFLFPLYLEKKLKEEKGI